MVKLSYKDFDFSFLAKHFEEFMLSEFGNCMKYEEAFSYSPSNDDYKELEVEKEEFYNTFIVPYLKLNDSQLQTVIKLQNALVKEEEKNFFDRYYFECSKSYKSTDEVFNLFMLTVKELNIFKFEYDFQAFYPKNPVYQCWLCGEKFNMETTHKSKRFCCDCGLKGDDRKTASNHKDDCCYKDWKEPINSLRECLKYNMSEMKVYNPKNEVFEREQKCIKDFMAFCYDRLAKIKFKYYAKVQFNKA